MTLSPLHPFHPLQSWLDKWPSSHICKVFPLFLHFPHNSGECVQHSSFPNLLHFSHCSSGSPGGATVGLGVGFGLSRPAPAPMLVAAAWSLRSARSLAPFRATTASRSGGGSVLPLLAPRLGELLTNFLWYLSSFPPSLCLLPSFHDFVIFNHQP